MKTSKKLWLFILIVVALLIGLNLFGPRSVKQETASVLDTSHGPAFEFRVVKPRMARPLFGILPTSLEEKLEEGGERRFDQTNSGAKVGKVAANHLELSADHWSLVIETDSQGKITAGTQLIYTMKLAEKQRHLRCRPAKEARGSLQLTSRVNAEQFDGNFVIELATCENAETGKVISWPPRPLTVRGSFAGLSNPPPSA